MWDKSILKPEQQTGSTAMMSRVAFCVVAALISGSATAADDWFNPALVSAGGENVADLERFAQGKQSAGVYHVAVRLNDDDVAMEDIRFVETESMLTANGGHIAAGDSGLYPCLPASWFLRNGVSLEAVPELGNSSEEQCILFTHLIDGAFYSFDFEKQTLTLNLPQAILKNKLRGYIPPEQWDQGIAAGLLNYMMTGQTGSGGDSYYLNLDGGFNLGAWRLRNNSAWTYQQSGQYTYRHWSNISTYAQRTIAPLRAEVVVGDASSSSDVFDALSFRGVRLYSDDSMLPDSVQGYAPSIKGVATARSKVTVKQRGYVVYQTWVPAGAFSIDDLSPSSSSGDLDVTVEGSDGHLQRFTVPYSTVSMLQREGRVRYEVVAGRYRSGSTSYDDPKYFQGSAQWGGPWSMTFYGGTQLASDYAALLVGAGRNMGGWGALSADITTARSTLADGNSYQGQSLRFRYAKSLTDYGTNLNLAGYRYSTRGYYSLDESAYKNIVGYEYEMQLDESGHYVPTLVAYHNLTNSKKGRAQLSISQQTENFGSFYLSGSQQTYWNQDSKDEWYQAGWSDNWQGISWNLAMSYSKYNGVTSGDRVISLSVSLPLGQWLTPSSNLQDRGWASRMKSRTSMSRTNNGKEVVQTGLSGSLLDDKSLTYNLTQSHSNRSGNSGTANAALDGRYGSAGLGYSYDSSGHYLNWSLTGGVIAHSKGITLGQRLGESNILVEADGASGVILKNQTGIKTDWRGYAIRPYATNYRRNKVSLDVNSLDEHTDLDTDSVDVIPTRGAVVKARFKTKVGYRALVTLSRNGQPIPFGSLVTEKNSGVTGIVGDNGEVYLSGMPESGILESRWGQGDSHYCQSTYGAEYMEKTNQILRLNLFCK